MMKKEKAEKDGVCFSSFRTEKGPDKGEKVSNLSCIKWFPVLGENKPETGLPKATGGLCFGTRGVRNLYLIQHKF